MNPDLKERLMGLFLGTKFPQDYNESWLTNVAFLHLGEAIEALACINDNFLSLEDLNATHPQSRAFFAILDDALTFFPSIPPKCYPYNQEKLVTRFSLEKKVAELPDNDYTTRVTNYLADDNDHYNNFNLLKKNAINKLVFLLGTELPELDAKITNLKRRIIVEGNNQDLINELYLSNELVKISQLQLMSIPDNNGNSELYCSVPDNVGGVTAKLALIHVAQVTERLEIISHCEDVASYFNLKEELKFSSTAILKLPKHGRITEVQREHLALNTARILGFNTTRSTMVSHNGKPALFIPFDAIALLQDFAIGEEQSAILPSSFSFKGLKDIGKKYFHYSIIASIGNGLNADQTIEDFGAHLAFAYLCSDTDFIGGKNQNKGIRDGKHFYVFDQVMMTRTKMKIDTRISLVPISPFRHTCHEQGRNRTIVEDSSFDSKFNSIIKLLEESQAIQIMFDNAFSINYARINSIKLMAANQPNSSPITDLQLLNNDLLTSIKAMNDRFTTLLENFPKLNNEVLTPSLFLKRSELIRHSLILEKLVNIPVLFSKDGRPYKFPWTYRNNNPILSIVEKDGLVHLCFKSLDIDFLCHILKRSGVKTYQVSEEGMILKISFLGLKKCTETSIFPALRAFDSEQNYLDIEELNYLKEAFPFGNRSGLIARVQQYQTQLATANTVAEKALFIKSAIEDIQTLGSTLKHKGFAKQVELNLQMDAQKQLRILLKSITPYEIDLTQAFNASVKLDRVNNFNQVLIAFILANKKDESLLFSYLINCVNYGELTTDYKQGKIQSEAMLHESLALLEQLRENSILIKNSTGQIMNLLGGSEHSGEELEFFYVDDEIESDNIINIGTIDDQNESSYRYK